MALGLMPLRNARVIPAGWSDHHKAAAAGGMNAVGQLHSPDGVGPYDPVTKTRPTVPGALHWSGAARIQAVVGEGGSADQAGQQVASRAYLLQLDETGDPLPDVHEGWVWRTTACHNDPHLVGRPLYVVDVQYGSERFTRDITCTDNLG